MYNIKLTNPNIQVNTIIKHISQQWKAWKHRPNADTATRSLCACLAITCMVNSPVSETKNNQVVFVSLVEPEYVINWTRTRLHFCIIYTCIIQTNEPLKHAQNTKYTLKNCFDKYIAWINFTRDQTNNLKDT